VHKFSIFLVISTWANPSRFRGAQGREGFVKKKSCSHFPMCNGGCQIPSLKTIFLFCWVDCTNSLLNLTKEF
jgi:hypothetical protein